MAGRQDAVLNVGASLVQGTQQAFAAIAKGFAAVSKGMSIQAKAMRAVGDAAGAAKFEKFSSSMAKATVEVSDQVAVLDKLKSGYKGAAIAGDKLTAATEKRARALAKEVIEAKKAATAAQKTTGGKKGGVDDAVVQKQISLIDHLNLSYKELIHSTEVYGLQAKKVMAELRADEIDPLKAADQIASLERRRNTYQKLSVELQHLTSLYPKEAAQLAKTDKSYRQQVDILNKLKTAKGKIAVASQKQAQADEKAQIKAAATLAKTQNQIKGLTFDYNKLLLSQTKYGNQAKQLIGSLLGMGANFTLVSKKIRRLNQEFKTSQMSAKQTAVAYKKLSKGYPEFQKRIKEYQRLGKDVNKLKEALERLHNIRQKVEKTTSDNRKRAQQIQLLTVRYDKLINSTDKYGKRAKQIQALLKKDPALIDRVSKSYQLLAARQERVFKSLTPLQQGMQRLGKSFKTYLSYMAASSVIFATLQIFREATTTIIGYDQSLKDLQAITQSTDEDVAAMGETIKQVASDTKFSATETAEGMKLLGQSGLSASESIDTIGAVANLATGTLTDMDTTVDLLTTSMRVFDIAAEDSARISDVWANAVNRSKLTIDKIRTAMNYIGPVAAAVGIEIEDVAGSMMIMANQGIRASTIGTGLRQVFRRLVDPSTEMKNALAAANLTMADMDPQVVGLEQVFDNLKLIVQDSGDAFRMFGQRGATAVLAVTKGGGGALKEMVDIVHRTGTAADMAAIQMEGLGVSFKNLQDKIKNLYIAIGEGGLAGSLRIFVDLARGLVDILTGIFSNTLVQITSQILLVGVAATGLGKILIWLGVILKTQVIASLARGSIAMGAYAVSTTVATGATGIFIRTLKWLRAALASTGLGLFVIAIGSLLAYMAGAEERVADTAREFKAMGLKIQDNIKALTSMKKALVAVGTTEEQVAGFTQKLADKYPEFKDKIEAAGGATEELNLILEDLIEHEAKLAQGNLKDQFEIQVAGMGIAANKLSGYTGTVTGAIRKLMGINIRGEAKKATETLQSFAESAAQVFRKLKETKPEITIEDLFGDLSVFDTKGFSSDIKELITSAVEKQEDAAEESGRELGRKVGTGLSEGMYASMSDDMLKTEIGLLKEDFQSAIKEHETALTKSLYKIEEMEARGLISHVDADMKKLNTTIQMYDKMLVKAQWYENEAKKTKDEKFKSDMEQKAENYREKAYKIRLDKLKKFGQEREKLEQKIATQETKQDDELTKHKAKLEEKNIALYQKRAEKIKAIKEKEVELWKTYEDKKADISRNLEEKLDDLRAKRLSKEQETASDIASIGDTIEDKILKIGQRGLEGKDLETAKSAAAANRYAAAEKALSAAKRNRDLEELGRAQKLYESSIEYYESLEDSGKAVRGLKKIGKALQEARGVQGELEVEAIDREIKKAEYEAKRKTQVAKTAYKEDLANFTTKQQEKLTKAVSIIDQQIAKENTRHDNEMSNIAKEIAELQKKAAIATAQQQRVMDSAPGSGGDYNQAEFDAGLDDISIPSPADYGLDELGNEIQATVKESVSKGINNGISESGWQEAGTKIEEPIEAGTKQGIQDGLFEGVKVEGMPLEEWKKKGVESGVEFVDGFDFAVTKDSEGVPISVDIQGDAEMSAKEMVGEIQTVLDGYPGEPSLDFTQAEQMIETFIRNAERNYKITIPVQAKAEGGPAIAMAGGGRIPGQDSPEDKVHVMARPGEWFIKNESVKSWSSSVGDWFMKGVNWPNSDAGRRLHELLDLNGSIAVQNRNLKKLTSKAVKQDSGMGEFGTINFNLPTEGPAVPAMMRPSDAAELMRQFNKMGRFAS